MADPLAELRATIEGASAALLEGREPGGPLAFERPPKAELGDYSSNAAMLLAPVLGEQPRTIADRIAERLRGELGDGLDRVEVAGPGFVNLFLSDAWYRDATASLAAAGEQIGRSEALGSARVLIEFVSANPTGPLTAAGGRHAAYGDSVARALELSGAEVQREYYVNDAGGQIERFAASIAARMRGDEPPEDGYEGEYVGELAASLEDDGLGPDDLARLAERGAELMRASAEKTLRRYRVEFDTWFSERSLQGGGLDEVLGALRERGHSYESDGATWLRSTEFGDDKDRVLVRSDGEPTYFLTDIAYHRDKLERGDGTLLDVLGADHHGYTQRLRAGLAALGLDPEALEFSIMQLVHIVEAGDRAQMSKRKGEFVTLDELLDDIGVDATRFFMLQRSHDTTLDLDLELARRQSNDNPVYYVQYAHARIASILRKAGEGRVADALTAEPASSELEPAERALIRRLLELPSVVSDVAERRSPHRFCTYATETASDFHAFYRDCQVLGAEGAGVEAERLRLAVIAQRTIARTLGLLGVSVPERM